MEGASFSSIANWRLQPHLEVRRSQRLFEPWGGGAQVDARLKVASGGESLDAEDVELMLLTQPGDGGTDLAKAQQLHIGGKLQHGGQRTGSHGVGKLDELARPDAGALLSSHSCLAEADVPVGRGEQLLRSQEPRRSTSQDRAQGLVVDQSNVHSLASSPSPNPWRTTSQSATVLAPRVRFSTLGTIFCTWYDVTHTTEEGPMDVSMPITTVVPSLDGPVLAALVATNAPQGLGAIHASAGRGSKSGIRSVLQRMVNVGLVLDVPGGYVLNRDHLVAPAVELLASLHGELTNRIRKAVEDWPINPKLVGLFGSAARRDGDANSDIDVLVISEDPGLDERVDELAERIRRWTGNRAHVIGCSPMQIARLQRAKEPILDEWIRDLVVIEGERASLGKAA